MLPLCAARIVGSPSSRLPRVALRVYREFTDEYQSRSFGRFGRRFRTKAAAFRVLDNATKGYVTDDASGKEVAVFWKGMLNVGKGQHERVTTTNSTLVRL